MIALVQVLNMSGESEFRFNWYGAASDERVLDVNLHTLERINGYTVEYGNTFKNARWARGVCRRVSLEPRTASG